MATIGQFMQPRNHQDLVDPNKVTPAPVMTTPAVIPFEPSPTLSAPMAVSAEPFQTAPVLSTPSIIGTQATPTLSSPLATIPLAPLDPKTDTGDNGTHVDKKSTFIGEHNSTPESTMGIPAIDTKTHHDVVFNSGVANKKTIEGSTINLSMGSFKIEQATVKSQIHALDTPEKIHQDHVYTRNGGTGGHDPTLPLLVDPLVSRIAIPIAHELVNSSTKSALKREAISLTQQALARNNIMTFAQKVKDLHSLVTKQKQTLIAMGIGKLTTALFPPTKEAYHPIQTPDNVPDQEDVNDIFKYNRYYQYDNETLKGIGIPTIQKTVGYYTPREMDLKHLNGPGDLVTKKDTLLSLWKKDRSRPGNYEGFVPSVNNKTIDFSADDELYDPNDLSIVNHFFTGSYHTFSTSQKDSLPSDDAVYMPLVFTDLRPINGSDNRSVYFKPFIKNLSEDFSPQWNMQNYFGRVDAVATYQNTNRTISLAFKIVAFTPEDLQINYEKLNWLTSMVYPEYKGGAYFSGPVIRMRVGDVISAGNSTEVKGVPGVITNLNFQYDETNWELLKDRKVPKNIDVSLGFHVLHEFPVGIQQVSNNNRAFGGIDRYNANDVQISRFRATFGNTDYLNKVTNITNTTGILKNVNSVSPSAGTSPKQPARNVRPYVGII